MKKYLIPFILLFVVNCANDREAPTVQITNPSDGATVCDTVEIRVAVQDNSDIERVELYIDGVISDKYFALPYVHSWVTNTLADSSAHYLLVKAYDVAGNEGVSDTISVIVLNGLFFPPPALALPANGSTVTQNPPTLVWHSVSESYLFGYWLEVSIDPMFGTGTIVYSNDWISPPDTQLTLPNPLSVGTYYWHACTWNG